MSRPCSRLRLTQREGPKGPGTEETMYEPSRLIQSFFIAGFQYYDGALALSSLKPGESGLVLVPEPDNPHDPDAVDVYFDGLKLGYVPADENGIVSLMCRFGHADVFEVRVLQVKADADPWKQVRVGVYVTDAR